MTERRKFVGQDSRAEAVQFVGLDREITVDVQTKTLRVHDGVTQGGSELATANLANVSEASVLAKCTAKEDKKNKVNSLSIASTDTEYPSAKCMYTTTKDLQDRVKNVEDNKANKDLSNLTDEAKNMLYNNSAPDWAKARDIGSGYVAPSKGMFVANGTLWYAGGFVRIAGHTVVSQTAGGPYATLSITGSWRVDKGDRIEFDGIGTHLFVPDKGV